MPRRRSKSRENKIKWSELSAKLRQEKPACEVCGKKDNLQCHHVTSKYYHKSLLRFDERNIAVLCPKCHYIIAHKSPIQFVEWFRRTRSEDYGYILRALGVL